MANKNIAREFLRSAKEYFEHGTKVHSAYPVDIIEKGLEKLARHEGLETKLESDLRDYIRSRNQLYLDFKTLVATHNRYLNLLCFPLFQDLVCGMKTSGVKVDQGKVLYDWEVLYWLKRPLATGTAKPLLPGEYKIVSALIDAGYPKHGSLETARKKLIEKNKSFKRSNSADTFRKRAKRLFASFTEISPLFNADAIPSGRVPDCVLDLHCEYQELVSKYQPFEPRTEPSLTEILEERRKQRRRRT